MHADKQIARHEIAVPGAVAIWTLPKIKPPQNWYNREHELDCADVFVALAKTSKLLHWDSEWTDDEHKEFVRRFGVYYDRRFELDGSDKVFFLEVDRGSEDVATLADKVRKYVKLAHAFPKQPIQVLFTVQRYMRQDLKNRTEKIIKHAIHPAKANEMFLVAPHDLFLKDPSAPVCITPSDWTKCVSLL